MSTKTTSALEQRAAKLRQTIEAPTERQRAAAELRMVESEIAEQREREARDEAERRMVGISRAYGSLANELTEDESRIRTAARAYVDAVGTVDARFQKLITLRAERDALVARFQIAGPELAVIEPPGRRLVFDLPMPIEHFRSPRPHVETNEAGQRRRSFEEIRGTEAFTIIARAGLEEWPELTPKQVAALAARRRQADGERAEIERYAGEVETLRHLPGRIA
jgi:hypothetical protein